LADPITMYPVAEALFVVVSGPPASGTSTLAPALAQALGLPLIVKDTRRGSGTTSPTGRWWRDRAGGQHRPTSRRG
jgi:hypothetical protein